MGQITYNSCTTWVPLGSVVQGLSAFMEQKYPQTGKAVGLMNAAELGLIPTI